MTVNSKPPRFDLSGYVKKKRLLPLPFSGARYADLGVSETPVSPSEKYSSVQGRATRKLRVAWNYRWDLAAYITGWAQAEYGAGGAFRCIRRTLPDPYQPTVRPVKVMRYQPTQLEFDGDAVGGSRNFVEVEEDQPWLWGTEVASIKGVGRQSKTFLPGLDPGLGSFSSYDYAEVEVTYEVKHYKLKSDDDLVSHGFSRLVDGASLPDEMYCARYCSFHPQPQVLGMSVPQDGLKWGADAPAFLVGKRASNETPRKKISIDVQMQWYGVPGLPRGLRSQLGTVNDRNWEVRPPGIARRFEAHTLIYLGFRLNTYRQVTGEFVHDISLLFSYFEEGHNKDLCFPPGGRYTWSTVTVPGYDASSDHYLKYLVYQESDFSNLFRLDDLV